MRLLQENAAAIAARAGRPLQVTAVCARDRSRDRGVDLSGCQWFDDPVALARDAEADVVVELIGGSEDPAKLLVETALKAGRDVVTANKALLAHHGTPLAELYIAHRRASERLAEEGIEVVRSLVGDHVTALEMQGCALTVLRLDDERIELWDAPVQTASLRWRR